MEKFLGILFCGGRGTRLKEITKYISKSFIPINNKPVFQYGLAMLEKSKYIDEIIILTNDDNDAKLKQTGYKAIIQDDSIVFDMFSGWEYIKKVTGTKKNAVLVPSDNITDIELDDYILAFMKSNADIGFFLYKVNDNNKLMQMGVFDINQKRFFYKPQKLISEFGVIAPYVVLNSIDCSKGDEFVFNNYKLYYQIHQGFWFDIGDYESIKIANKFFQREE